MMQIRENVTVHSALFNQSSSQCSQKWFIRSRNSILLFKRLPWTLTK